jgi:predicted regulator of Ras-like GTPase activity (Roadblock/LC7/MglB family)
MANSSAQNVQAVPAGGRSERGRQIERLLTGLTSLRGVIAAAIVDNDGFVTHVRRDFEINTDALGAAVQIVFGAARRASEHVKQGVSSLVLTENKDGMILLAPLVNGFVLAVVADQSAMLGATRFELKESIPQLNQLFA